MKLKIMILSLILCVSIFFACNNTGDNDNGNKKDSKSSGGAESYDYSSVPKNAEFVFLASHNGNLDDYKHKALILLKNYVELKSNGKIGIQIYPNGQLASNVNESMNGIIDESFDIVNTTGDVSSYWAPFSVFDLPYMLTSDRMAEMVFNDPEFIKDLREGALKKTENARLMIITNSGRWRNIATTKKQIKTPKDLAGLKIRTIASKVQQELTKALGASPTAMAWGEVYTSLATGVVDGTKNGIVDIVNAKLHESLKYIMLDGHAYMAGFWWINNKKFMSMSEDLRKVMADGFDSMNWFLRTYTKYTEAFAYQEFKAAGGTVYNPTKEDIESFKKESKKVEEWFLSNSDEEVKQWLTKYKDKIAEKEATLKNIYQSETE